MSIESSLTPPTRLRAVVVDDEPAAREAVVTLLAEVPEIELVGEASNGRQAVEVVRQVRPDMLFLDVQMPDLDGFGVLESLGAEVPRGVVFVTAHDEHAIRAFEVHALDYLLKPFGRPRFQAAVARALERLRAMDALTLVSTLSTISESRKEEDGPGAEVDLEPSAEPTRLPRRIGVRMGAKTTLVEVEQIEWIEALGDYARIHTAAGSHVITQRMHLLERLLPAPQFLRVHRSLIVNLRSVRELHRESDGSGALVLQNRVRLRVARGRWEMLQQALEMAEL